MDDITRETNPVEFTFLDDLRKSGEVNMYGAGRWLQKVFTLDRADARDILKAWMKEPRKTV